MGSSGPRTNITEGSQESKTAKQRGLTAAGRPAPPSALTARMQHHFPVEAGSVGWARVLHSSSRQGWLCEQGPDRGSSRREGLRHSLRSSPSHQRPGAHLLGFPLWGAPVPRGRQSWQQPPRQCCRCLPASQASLDLVHLPKAVCQAPAGTCDAPMPSLALLLPPFLFPGWAQLGCLTNL